MLNLEKQRLRSPRLTMVPPTNNTQRQLPPNWTKHYSQKVDPFKPFYYNNVTNESQWNFPQYYIQANSFSPDTSFVRRSPPVRTQPDTSFVRRSPPVRTQPDTSFVRRSPPVRTQPDTSFVRRSPPVRTQPDTSFVRRSPPVRTQPDTPPLPETSLDRTSLFGQTLPVFRNNNDVLKTPRIFRNDNGVWGFIDKNGKFVPETDFVLWNIKV